MTLEGLLFELNSLKMQYLYDYDCIERRLISKKEDIIIYFDDNFIFADRIDNFDKPSKCPVKLPAPQGDAQLKYLQLRLKWLATNEGYEYSKNNRYTDVEVYPFDEYETQS